MPPRVRAPKDEFTELLKRSLGEFTDAFRAVAKAVAGSGSVEVPRKRLETLIGETMTLADLMGRRRVFLEFDGAVARDSRAGGFSLPETNRILIDRSYRAASLFVQTPVIPNAPFSEAMDDLLSREPRLAANAEEVAALYRDRHAFALARASELRITDAVQRFVERAVKEGIAPSEASVTVKQISAGVDDFTTSYSKMVYRTNLNTAYSAGRFRQAEDPDIARVMPALERYEIIDSNVRRGRKEDGGENHAAAHGLIAATNDPIWNRVASPSGYG